MQPFFRDSSTFTATSPLTTFRVHAHWRTRTHAHTHQCSHRHHFTYSHLEVSNREEIKHTPYKAFTTDNIQILRLLDIPIHTYIFPVTIISLIIWEKEGKEIDQRGHRNNECPSDVTENMLLLFTLAHTGSSHILQSSCIKRKKKKVAQPALFTLAFTFALSVCSLIQSLTLGPPTIHLIRSQSDTHWTDLSMKRGEKDNTHRLTQ